MRKATFCGRTVKGVVFDLDGTLIHSTVDFTMMKRRIIDSLLSQGVPSSLLDVHHTTLENTEVAIAHLSAVGRKEEGREIRAMVGEMMSRIELERVSRTTAVEGAGECARLLRAAELKIGMLTRGSRAYAQEALHYAGLDMRLDAMICRDDYPEEEAKPNGMAMVRMASMLGLRPEDCLLVGDHSMDLHCARSSGASFVGVLTGAFGMEEWSQDGCERTISSVKELPDLLLVQNGRYANMGDRS
jgi:phosphoglycolate phosphatase-like HAD superfamily hydrolase